MIIERGPTRFTTLLVQKWLSLFLETNNPIYAWRTYQNARNLREDVPDEVLKYLDNVAHQIVKIANNPPSAKDRPLEIAKALGLGKRGAGAGSQFNDYTDRQNARKMAMETFEKLGQSDKEYAVYQEIADKYKSSESTVRRYYKEHLEKWQKEVESVVDAELVEFHDGKVKLQLAVYGTADDLRESAIILDLIKDKLKSNPA